MRYISVRNKEQFSLLKELYKDNIENGAFKLIVPLECASSMLKVDMDKRFLHDNCYIRLPEMLRTSCFKDMDDVVRAFISCGCVKQFDEPVTESELNSGSVNLYIDSIDGFGYALNLAKDESISVSMILGDTVYAYNSDALHTYYDLIKDKTNVTITGFVMPYELSLKDVKLAYYNVLDYADEVKIIVTKYAKPRVMTSTQCIKATKGECSGKYKDNRYIELIKDDKFGKSFVDECNCKYCYNYIYEMNTISLVDEDLPDFEGRDEIICFVDESEEQMKDVLAKVDEGKVLSCYKGHLDASVD